MKRTIYGFLLAFLVSFILTSCDIQLRSDAPYKLIDPDNSTMVYGVYPQGDGTYKMVVHTNTPTKTPKSEICSFDSDWQITERKPLPLDSLAVIKKVVEGPASYWMVVQNYVYGEGFSTSILQVDREGNELFREQIATSAEMLDLDVFMQDGEGTMVIYRPDQTLFYRFRDREIDHDYLVVGQPIDRVSVHPDKAGALYASGMIDGVLTIFEFNLANQVFSPILSTTGFPEGLKVRDFAIGAKTLVALYHAQLNDAPPSDQLIYVVSPDNPPIQIPYKGFVTDFLDWNGTQLIAGVEKEGEKTQRTSAVKILEVTDDNTTKALHRYDPKNLVIPEAILSGDTVILYGHVGHPLLGLTGFVQEIALK